LADALELTALIALKDRPRSRRVAARWLQWWLDEAHAPTIDEAAMVAGCLVALGGSSQGRFAVCGDQSEAAHHDEALSSLRAMTERGSGGRR
jgi:hypothetical protein